jgi:putative transposase
MTWGFGYRIAFVIDAFAGLIPGWACSTSTHTRFIESAIPLGRLRLAR